MSATETQMSANDTINVVIWLLVAVAAVNWGTVAALDVNFVEALIIDTLGLQQSALDLIYIGVGALGVYDIAETFQKL